MGCSGPGCAGSDRWWTAPGAGTARSKNMCWSAALGRDAKGEGGGNEGDSGWPGEADREEEDGADDAEDNW